MVVGIGYLLTRFNQVSQKLPKYLVVGSRRVRLGANILLSTITASGQDARTTN